MKYVAIVGVLVFLLGMLNIRELEAWIFGAGKRNLEGMGG